jgi:hypothetical protein
MLARLFSCLSQAWISEKFVVGMEVLVEAVYAGRTVYT